MMWRYGVLYRACNLIELLDGHPQSEAEILESFRDESYRNVRIEDVIAVACNCSWVVRCETSVLEVTTTGRDLLNTTSDMMRMRLQVERLLEITTPSWAALAVQGRQALLTYADAQARQCFKEAGLSTGTSEDVVGWWDRLAAKYRGVGSYQYTEIGRKGERLSVDHEYARTGTRPEWTALEFSDAGYDLVSKVSADVDQRMVIEVKTTTQAWNDASFFMSRHEWNILSNENNAVVHLWSINGMPPQRATVTLDQLAAHVPEDTGAGVWKKFSCPFKEFAPIPIVPGLPND